jgi:hypothetical protein
MHLSPGFHFLNSFIIKLERFLLLLSLVWAGFYAQLPAEIPQVQIYFPPLLRCEHAYIANAFAQFKLIPLPVFIVSLAIEIFVDIHKIIIPLQNQTTETLKRTESLTE